MTITPDWLDRKLRAVYATFHAPIPRNWPDVLGIWAAAVADLRQERVETALDRIVATKPTIKGLKIAAVVSMASERPATIHDIIEVTAEEARLHPSQLVGKSRAKAIAQARMVAMMLARELTGKSYPVIGRAFGGRDNTTALSACRRAPELMDGDPDIAALVAGVRARLMMEAR